MRPNGSGSKSGPRREYGLVSGFGSESESGIGTRDWCGFHQFTPTDREREPIASPPGPTNR